MVNRQQFTSRLATTFSVIIQFIAPQNTFMSFPNIFSQCNKLDKKIQRENPTEMKFPTVKHKPRKKDYLDIHLFYQ